MENFQDSTQFKIGHDGSVCHSRDGETWADKVLDGVSLDNTMYWENCGYYYIIEESEENMVDDKKNINEIQETTKTWGKEKGEGKFKRNKKIPQKKNKKHPTKPKHSWHKRLSKVAQEIGDINVQTIQKAHEEWNDFWDERMLQIETIEQKKESEYWDKWVQEVKDFYGHYAIISVKILVDPNGVSVHDIDAAGVKRDNCFDIYNEGRVNRYAMKEWDMLPSVVGEGGWCGQKGTFVEPGFSFQEYNFFTYWDQDNDYYVWESMNSHQWQSGGWRDHFDYYPNIEKMKDIFCLDKQYLPWREVGTLSKWIDGINWQTVWDRMDQIRTGIFGREHYFDGENGWLTRSRMGSKNYQIPRMVFK